MTPKLIRTVAAACVAAAFLPAQEVREVIVREKSDKGKASSKALNLSSATSKQLAAIIEQMRNDELSSAERTKLKNALMKMLGDASGKPASVTFDAPVALDVLAEATPSGIRLHSLQGKESKKAKAADLPAGVEWVALSKELKKDGKVKKTYTWIENVEPAHDHGKGHEHGEHGEHGGNHSNKGEHGDKRAAIIAELNKSLSRGHGAGGKVGGLNEAHGVELKTRAIARLPKPDGEHDAIAYVRESKDGDGKTVRWLKTSKQGQGKAKKAKGGDLATRAKALRVRLNKPGGAAGGLAYVFDTESEDSGKSARLQKAQKAYEKAKKAYAEAKKAHGKAAKVEGRYGFVELDDVTEAYGVDARGAEGTVHYFRAGKQDPKKGKAKAKKAVEYLIESGETIQFEPGSEVIEYLPGGYGEDVRIFLRGKDGKLKKGSKESDGWTYEWMTDTGIDVLQGKAKSKAKSKSKGGSFVFETDAKGLFKLRKPKASKQAKGTFFFDTRIGSRKDDSGERDVLLKLKGQGDEQDFWVVDGKDGKEAGAWVTHIPSIEKDVLLKLLHSDGADREIRTVLRMIDGKDSKAKGTNHDALLKLLGVDAPHAHGHEVEVIVEEREEEEEEEEIEEGDNAEVLEMIEEMRTEMRELRSMMQEIRNSLRSNNAGSNATRRVRSRQLPPAVRKEDAAPVRVRRRAPRETR